MPHEFTSTNFYPTPSAAALKLHYVGKRIEEVQAPAAIVDAAVARRNCRLMLESCRQLGVGFRAHVKTHKTTELTELQVGTDSKSIRLVASTVAEIESLTPWLLERKKQGKLIDVLYGLPVAPSAVPRLAVVARMLGMGTVGLFVDHPDHIAVLDRVAEAAWPGKIPVFVNIDVGYLREGVPPGSQQLADIARALAASTRTTLTGVYTHMGQSYGVSSPEEALKFMSDELHGLEQGAAAFLNATEGRKGPSKVVLSLGASPTATSIQNILYDTAGGEQYRQAIARCAETFEVEFHAGVYPLMDMQQLATRARPQHILNAPEQTLLSFKDLGLRILAEVASVYSGRRDKHEALVAAGSIVLGRDPCKSYPGWGVVSPWPMKDAQSYDPEGTKTGWIVGSIAQEHGILTWEGEHDRFRPLEVGGKLLIWPNHACIASANFGWYLVVDSESKEPDRVEDVWVRWRGW